MLAAPGAKAVVTDKETDLPAGPNACTVFASEDGGWSDSELIGSLALVVGPRDNPGRAEEPTYADMVTQMQKMRSVDPQAYDQYSKSLVLLKPAGWTYGYTTPNNLMALAYTTRTQILACEYKTLTADGNKPTADAFISACDKARGVLVKN